MALVVDSDLGGCLGTNPNPSTVIFVVLRLPLFLLNLFSYCVRWREASVAGRELPW